MATNPGKRTPQPPARAKPKADPAAPPPLIIVAGEELFLRNEHLRDIQRAIFADEDPGMGLVRLEAGLAGDALAAILDEVRTPSMFAPRKIVVVDPADLLFKKEDSPASAAATGVDDRLSNREILEHYLEAPVDGATLVLVVLKWPKTTRLHKALEKIGGVRRAESKKDHELVPWINARAPAHHGKTIEPAAAAKLAELIGPDLQRLDNELAKLSLYELDPIPPAKPDAIAEDPAAQAGVGTGKAAGTITLKAVNDLVGFQHDQEIWDMLQALAARNAPESLKKIDELWGLDTKIGFTATAAVFFWINQVLRARELVDQRLPDAVIGRELRLWPPDRAQKVVSLARSWGLEGAARWSQAMLHMDLANKSSLGDPRRNLEKFVVEMCAA